MIILNEKVKYVIFWRNYFPLKLERTLMMQSLLSKLTIKKTMGHQQIIKKKQCTVFDPQCNHSIHNHLHHFPVTETTRDQQQNCEIFIQKPVQISHIPSLA